MLIRISLIVAIVAGLATAIIGFTELKSRLATTIQARDQFEQERDQERTAHNKTKKTLKDTEATLEKTTKDLADTTAQRDALQSEKDQLTQANLRLTQIGKELKESRDSLQQELNQWASIGNTVNQVRAIIAERKKLTEERDAFVAENKVLLKKNGSLQEKIDGILGKNRPVILPEGLRGEVVAVDPKFDFVVLNIGGDAGVKERGELLVNRNGQLIAKLRVSSVSPTHSIANILPEWTKGTDGVMEGDKVLP
jgi:predicted RNase H-like nuclease (RuvC/YqgF family)